MKASSIWRRTCVIGGSRPRGGSSPGGGTATVSSLPPPPQPPLQLRALERFLSLGDRHLEPLADAVQQDAGVAVADTPQCLGELALAARVSDANGLEPVHGRRRVELAAGVLLVRLPGGLVHGGGDHICFVHGSSSLRRAST